jgi:hypothetical protein
MALIVFARVRKWRKAREIENAAIADSGLKG